MNNITSLVELNAAHPPTFREWMGWTLRREYAVGRAGRQNARRGTMGAKSHLLMVEVIVSVGDDAKYADRVGELHRVRGCTSSNGQFTGTVVKGAELAGITCKRCLSKLAELAAVRRAQGVA
jgi:hypothetical protein